MKFIIRKALPEDVYDYTDVIISSWQSAYKGIVPDEFLSNMSVAAEREQRIEKYRKNLSDPEDCVNYCVIYEERMIGILTIHKNGEIWSIYLLEEFCGKGYGKELLDFEVAELKNMGHNKISLWVFEDNMRARRFYEKHGFCLDGGKREMKYGKPLVQLRYVLNI